MGLLPVRIDVPVLAINLYPNESQTLRVVHFSGKGVLAYRYGFHSITASGKCFALWTRKIDATEFPEGNTESVRQGQRK